METFKKIISLSQAAHLSGYSQDYLGFLIRHGEIKGVRNGRIWFTTEDEVNNYLFKKKIRGHNFAIKEFFSLRRIKNILISALIIFISGILLFTNFNKQSEVPVKEIKSAVSSDGGVVKIIEQ